MQAAVAPVARSVQVGGRKEKVFWATKMLRAHISYDSFEVRAPGAQTAQSALVGAAAAATAPSQVGRDCHTPLALGLIGAALPKHAMAPDL